ncbi:hypothetical protein CDD82_266 [Ophiocordyceps australis]|uniref:Uncharacterized protein n=1 Tax=Ophiocordyceps australis TaxID=1399860 RepID=A0A2C5YND6_9HYPO|nr:hypothetical protein CDD82_266 [Ophiocordyceps australis]
MKPTDQLEALRRLINQSIDTVQQDIALHRDVPLSLEASASHPIRQRHDEHVARALKSLASSGTMLRALSHPHAWLNDICFGSCDLTALLVACEIDTANLLSRGALDARSIANKTGIDADSITRHLRALCNLYIFSEEAPNVFRNNELSLMLQPEAVRALVGFLANEGRMASSKQWEVLAQDSGSGRKTAFQVAYDTDLSVYDYWKHVRPDWGKRAAKAFSSNVNNLEQYLALYPWAKEEDGALVVDVGGGIGGATLPIVRRFPKLRVKVQDREENREGFEEYLENEFPDVAAVDGASFEEQDYFEANKTRNADIYLLRHIVHNWPDEEASKLLRNVAAAMTRRSKLLLCECVVHAAHRGASHASYTAPEPLLANWGQTYTSRVDLMMQAMLDARQRSQDEFEALVAGAGLVVTRVWRNMGEEAMVECRLL